MGTYSQRTVAVGAMRPVTRRIRDALKSFTLCLVRRPDLTESPSPLPEPQARALDLTIFLSTSHGGLGLTDPEKVAAATFLGCARLVLPTILRRLGDTGRRVLQDPDFAKRVFPDVDEALAVYRASGIGKSQVSG